MSRDRGPRLKKIRRVRALPGLVQSKYKKIRRVGALPGLVQSKYNIKKKTPFRIRRRMKGISRRGNSISFDRCRYALQALEPVWIEAETIEAGRRAIKRYVRDGAIWVLPDKHVTISTTKSRWGKHTWLLPNKPVTIPTGDPIYCMCKYLVCVIEPGDVLYEVSGVSETIARKALARAADKMPTLLGYTTPIKTQFIYIK